jgi:hypothetical protein
VLCDLAISLAVGGDCLADVAVLRTEPGVYGPVASDPTVSRTIDVLAADADRALAAIDAARARARATVWGLAAEHAPDANANAETPLIIDVDATLVTAHSDKEAGRADVQTWVWVSPVVRVRGPRDRRHRGAAERVAACGQRRVGATRGRTQ